ncbi:hypothetical protein HK100_009828, partial [Physocladia obscura]
MADIETINSKNIFADMTAAELANTHPNWDNWQPQNASEAYIISVRHKLAEGGFGNLAKCLVDPAEARALSLAQGIEGSEGFWLIPPLKAYSDVKLFSCGDRCSESGTSIFIPEHKVAYPTKRGSIVTVKKGEFYGVGVLNTKVFDDHMKKGFACCSKDVVMLRSIKQSVQKKALFGNSAAALELAEAIDKVNLPIIEKRVYGPLGFMKAKLLLGSCMICGEPKSKTSSSSFSSVNDESKRGAGASGPYLLLLLLMEAASVSLVEVAFLNDSDGTFAKCALLLREKACATDDPNSSEPNFSKLKQPLNRKKRAAVIEENKENLQCTPDAVANLDDDEEHVCVVMLDFVQKRTKTNPTTFE